MSRQIGPWSREPLAVMLEWRLRELDARLRAIETRLDAWPPEHGERGERGENGEHAELAGLTAEEAREMAAGLLAQADAAEEHAANAGVAD